MALAITNLKISDIVKILTIVAKTVNISNLHRSPNVIGTGLDATYCPGTTGYDRLIELRKLPLEIGKFRNYDTVTVNYKVGLLYNYYCVYPSVGQFGVHIPSGWRIATYADFSNILLAAQPLGNWLSNIVGTKLKSIYREADSTRFGWRGVTNTDNYSFKGIGCGIGIFNGSYEYVWDNSGLLVRFWDGNPLYSNQCTQLDQTSMMSRVALSDIFGDKYYKFCNIRLVKNDSTNPDSVTDIDGNIYKTIKIGNTVITAESIRTKTNSNETAIFEFQDATPYFTESDAPGYINTEGYDIP